MRFRVKISYRLTIPSGILWLTLVEDIKLKVSITSWPSPQDYNEALQNPAQSFADEDLRSGSADVDNFGIPRPSTGMFASVYKLACAGHDWAVRCFLHYVPDQTERYAAISEALSRHKIASTVNFDLQERGAFIHGQWFPILKMQWCNGETLDRWLAGQLDNLEALNKFLREWKALIATLEHAGIAHGDLQHGNVLIENGQIKLVDYDGMYVPKLAGRLSNELGHRAYQHPGRAQEHFSADLDRFSAWIIYCSVKILSVDPGIWTQINAGDDCLLFRHADLASPLRSPVFNLLENHESSEVRDAARAVRYLLSLDLNDLPSLSAHLSVPLNLPELLEPAELPRWFEQAADDSNRTAAGQANLLAEDPPEESTMNSAVYGKKRQRSRIKGGARGMRGSRLLSPPAVTLVEAPPIRLSPLARLARQVTGKTVPAEAQIAGGNTAISAGNYQAGSANAAAARSANAPNSMSQNFAALTGAKSADQAAFSNSITFTLIAAAVGLVIILLLYFATSGTQLVSSTEQNSAMRYAEKYMRQHDYDSAAYQYNSVITSLQAELSEDKKPRSAAEIAETAENRKLLSRAEIGLGDVYFVRHQFDWALTEYSAAVDSLRPVSAVSIELAYALGKMASAYSALNRVEYALDYYDEAIAMYASLKVDRLHNADLNEYMDKRSNLALLHQPGH